MAKVYTSFLLLCSSVLVTATKAQAQNTTRFYLQDFGNVSNYSPTSNLVSYFNTNSGPNSQYSYNAIFNAGAPTGVAAANLKANPPAGFSSYTPLNPNSQPNDGYYSISQHEGAVSGGNTAQSLYNTTYNLTGYGTTCWDHTTGGTDNKGAKASSTSAAPQGLFMFINANPANIGRKGGTYFELPLSILNIPGATYTASLWWRDMHGGLDYSTNSPIPAFVGIDVNTVPHTNLTGNGSSTSLANKTNPASSLATSATSAQKLAAAPRDASNTTGTVAGSWQELTTTFQLAQNFQGSALYFNVYNSDPGFNNTSGNDIGIDDIALDMLTIADLSGTVYDLDGSGIGSNATAYTNNGLYAVLVDKNNKVIQSVKVGSDGKYSFVTDQTNNQFIPYATNDIGMKIVLSTTNPNVGTPNFTSAGLDGDRVSTGYNYSGGGFVKDNTTSGMPVTKTNTNISGANFYLEHKPSASDATNELQSQPKVGDKINPALGGADVEDVLAKTITFTAIPDNGTLLYNGQPVTKNQKITDFDPSKIEYEFTGAGYTESSFTYYFTDNAGVNSNIATYTITIPYVLPIQLQSFDVILKNNVPYLQWTTASEINNAGFNIQRSTDASNWTTIAYKASRAAGGNSSLALSYDYSDPASFIGTNYYRLEQIDLDGKASPLRVRSVTVTSGVEISVAPNPATNYIRVTNAAIGSELRIVGMDGKIYRTALVTGNTQNVDLANMLSGLYFVQVTKGNSIIASNKFVKQ